jgi:hypothetical protein
LDIERFEEIADIYGSLLDRIDFKGTVIQVFGKSVNVLAENINKTASRNPYFLRDALRYVDGMQVFRAFLAVVGSAFLCLVSRLIRLFSRS